MMDTYVSNANPEGQALVRIDPAGDPRVHALGLEVLELVRCAETCVVASDDDARSATSTLVIIRGLKGTFETKRKEFTAPLNDYLKDINAAFKEFTLPLEQADKGITSKILAYRAEQEAINRARAEANRLIEESNRLKEEAARREMQLTGELSQSVDLVEIPPELPEPPKHYRTPVGDLGKRSIRKWRVINKGDVPEEYKILNETLIGQLVRKGIPSIPGLEIYEEEVLVVTHPHG